MAGTKHFKGNLEQLDNTYWNYSYADPYLVTHRVASYSVFYSVYYSVYYSVWATRPAYSASTYLGYLVGGIQVYIEDYSPVKLKY